MPISPTMDRIPDIDPAPYLETITNFNAEFDEIFKLPGLDSLLVHNPAWHYTCSTSKRISIQDYFMAERETAQQLHLLIVSTLLDVVTFIVTYEQLIERASSVDRQLRVSMCTVYDNNRRSIMPISDEMKDLSTQCGIMSSCLTLFLQIIERAMEKERETARCLKRLKISSVVERLRLSCTRFGNKVVSRLSTFRYFREIVAMGSLPTLGIFIAAAVKIYKLFAAEEEEEEEVASPQAETLKRVKEWAEPISEYLNKIRGDIALMARLLRDIHTLSANCSDPQLYDIVLSRKLRDQVSTLKTQCIEALEGLEARFEAKADGS